MDFDLDQVLEMVGGDVYFLCVVDVGSVGILDSVIWSYLYLYRVSLQKVFFFRNLHLITAQCVQK